MATPAAQHPEHDDGTEQSQHPKQDTVTIIYLGEPRPLRFESHESVEAALNQALNLFGITSNRHLLALFDEGGNEITDEKQSMEEAGVKPGAKLLLGQSKVKGG
jgi:hypothetical protein